MLTYTIEKTYYYPPCAYCSFSGPGVLICSIDNMPAQIPREATSYFGSLLCPYVHDMVSERVLQAASLTRTIYTDWLYQYRLA